jgi:hypothetical protein
MAGQCGAHVWSAARDCRFFPSGGPVGDPDVTSLFGRPESGDRSPQSERANGRTRWSPRVECGKGLPLFSVRMCCWRSGRHEAHPIPRGFLPIPTGFLPIPTGFRLSAQGCLRNEGYPGNRGMIAEPYPNGVASVRAKSLIPHVALVPLDSVFPEEHPVFILERRGAVVLFLGGDILLDGIEF